MVQPKSRKSLTTNTQPGSDRSSEAPPSSGVAMKNSPSKVDPTKSLTNSTSHATNSSTVQPEDRATTSTEEKPQPAATRKEMVAYILLGLVSMLALVIFVHVGTVEAAIAGTIIIFGSRSVVLRVLAGRPPPYPSEGRTIVIVGPSDDQNTTMGKALSKLWNDANIIVCLQEPETARTMTSQWNSSKTASERLRMVTVDGSSEHDVGSMVQIVRDIAKENGVWSVLNLSVPGRRFDCALGDVEITRGARYQQSLEALGANILLVKSLLPLLRAANGRIITLHTQHARVPSPFTGPLDVYQAGLSAFHSSLRVELQRFRVRYSQIETLASVFIDRKGEAKRGVGRGSRESSGGNREGGVNIHETYDLTTPTTLEDYGAEYIEYMKARWVETVPVNHPDILAAVQNALWSFQPKSRYTVRCSTSSTSFIQRYPGLAQVLPHWFTDQILMFDYKDSPLPLSAPDPHDSDDDD